MSFPYGNEYEEMAKAMVEVMKTHPDRERAIAFRDGTHEDLISQAEKDFANEHYYEWLQFEAEKLLKEKKKKEEPASMPTPGGGKPPPPKAPPVSWTEGSRESAFKDDAICCCPECRKARK